MNLHENIALFKDAVKITAEKKEIKDIYIEKDYWVTFVLHHLYNSKLGKEIVFKGGTSLSKCYGLIDRFSEDIDLIILKKEGQSDHYLKKKLKKITTAVSKHLPEIQQDDITHKMGMVRKTAHTYPKVFKGNFGQVRDTVILETTRLGQHEPFFTKTIASYIFEMMLSTNQEKIAAEYNMLPFEVLALDVKRTLCEKIMSLVRFSYSENPIVDLNNKIRHTYDIHKLLEDDDIKSFFKSNDFDTMMLRVGQDDVVSFKNHNEYLKNSPKEALLFSETKETWGQMVNTYQTSFKDLVFRDFPDESEILKTLLEVSERLNTIAWNIEIENAKKSK